MFRASKIGGASAVALAFVFTAAAAAAAPADRQLDCGSGVLYDAVMLTKATVHGSEVPCHWSGRFQPPAVFQAGGDWLTNTDIYLFNPTSKQIVYGELLVTFPNGPTRNTVRIRLGAMPAVAAWDQLGNPIPQNGRAPLAFGPGQPLVIHLADYINDIADALKPTLPTALTKVKIDLESFIFDDGMRWNPGAVYLVPDPSHPGQWRHMPRGYHPDGYGKARR